MCFLTEQVLEFIQKHQLGNLLVQIKPMYTYVYPEAPMAEEERVADDLATTAGTVLDYGPEDFGKDTLLEVIKFIHKTDPKGEFVTTELYQQIQEAFNNIEEE